MINPLSKFEATHVKTIVCTKIVLSASFIAVSYLPPSHAVAVGVVSNLVWLWKF